MSFRQYPQNTTIVTLESMTKLATQVGLEKEWEEIKDIESIYYSYFSDFLDPDEFCMLDLDSLKEDYEEETDEYKIMVKILEFLCFLEDETGLDFNLQYISRNNTYSDEDIHGFSFEVSGVYTLTYGGKKYKDFWKKVNYIVEG